MGMGSFRGGAAGRGQPTYSGVQRTRREDNLIGKSLFVAKGPYRQDHVGLHVHLIHLRLLRAFLLLTGKMTLYSDTLPFTCVQQLNFLLPRDPLAKTMLYSVSLLFPCTWQEPDHCQESLQAALHCTLFSLMCTYVWPALLNCSCTVCCSCVAGHRHD